MTVSVKFDNVPLVPAPKVSVNKTYIESGDGGILASEFTITLNGVISAPLSGSDTSNLGSILSSQNSIRNTFSQDLSDADSTGAGKILNVDGHEYDGCHVESLSFEGGTPREVNLNQLGFYTVVLKCTDYNADNDNFTYNIISASENWEVEYAEDIKDAVTVPDGSSVNVKTAYRVSHTVSATGKPKYKTDSSLDTDGLAWQQARLYVINTLGLQAVGDSSLGGGADTTNTLDVPSGLNNRNHVRTQSVDEKGGTFSVTETFVLYDSTSPKNVMQDIEVTVSQNPAESQRTTVTVNGTLTGLRSGLSNVDDSYSNALSYFNMSVNRPANLKNQAKNLSGIGTSVTLNEIPLSKVIGKNPAEGTVTYSVEFDDRPAVTLTDALSESATVNDSHPGYLFGSTPAIGRGIKGPILQWLGAGTESTRSLTLEVVWPPIHGYCNPVTSLPSKHTTYGQEIKQVIANAAPGGTSFCNAPTETWDPANGRYTLEISWTYEYSGLDMFAPLMPTP